MKASTQKLLKRVSNAKRDVSELTHITSKAMLTTEDKLKVSLCKHFVQFANSKRLKAREISALTGIPAQRLSEIMNYKISKYTIDKLIENLELIAKHDPQMRASIDLFLQAVATPPLKVIETRKLIKELKNAALESYVS